MPVRLGQFYAFVLLLTCLATNIVFFSEVRESFLGDEDPTASVKLAFSELNIQAKIAEFYPKIQSKADEVQNVTLPVQKDQKPVTKEPKKLPELPPNVPIQNMETANPILDPFLLPSQPPTVQVTPKEIPPKESEVPKPVDPVIVPKKAELNRQTAATMPIPKSAASNIKPIIADQFKPVIIEPNNQ